MRRSDVCEVTVLFVFLPKLQNVYFHLPVEQIVGNDVVMTYTLVLMTYTWFQIKVHGPISPYELAWTGLTKAAKLRLVWQTRVDLA